jgi:hypothetical protein
MKWLKLAADRGDAKTDQSLGTLIGQPVTFLPNAENDLVSVAGELLGYDRRSKKYIITYPSEGASAVRIVSAEGYITALHVLNPDWQEPEVDLHAKAGELVTCWVTKKDTPDASLELITGWNRDAVLLSGGFRVFKQELNRDFVFVKGIK